MALTKFRSRLIADTGISTGDEGKGRLIPEVIRELQAETGRQGIVSVVMKVNGGANSGHTVGGLKLNLLPAGVIEKDVAMLAIGAGVVADPRKFHWEAQPLEKMGIPIYARLRIDERTMLSDVSHRMLDLAFEDYRVNVLKHLPRGSTGRGITPAYCDEVGQWQITYADFLGTKEDFAEKLNARLDRAERTIEHVCRVAPEQWGEFFKKLSAAEARGNAPAIRDGIFAEADFDFTQFDAGTPFRFNRAKVVDVYWEAGQKLVPAICDVREIVLEAMKRGEYVIGEFGQAYWLDKRHGFPPNVTASHTFTPEFFQSAGIPAQLVHTMGCCKAYDTKVGTHVFLTQMDDEHPLCKRLKKLEFGVVSGRQRMVGWCDCVEKADALRYGGYQDLVINKLDALSPKIYKHVPRNDALRQTLVPVYETLPGWTEDISGVRSFADLPANAKRYIAFVMKTVVELADAPELPNLRYIGVGPLPSQIIKDVPATAELIKLAEVKSSVFFRIQKSGELLAVGRDMEKGTFEVFAGSVVRKLDASGNADLRKSLLDSGVINGNVFVCNYVFSSRSAAAGQVLGRSSNGNLEWQPV